jgi:hypothetical protein
MKVTIPDNEIHGENTIDNKLEILKFASQVQSRIRDDISEDFILAKLGEKDKEGIVEMTSNAYFMKKILAILKDKGTKYDWDIKNKAWVQRKLNDNEKDFIEKVANATFDSYLTRIYMVVILNRNVPNNHLLNILAGATNQEDNEELEGFKARINELMKPEEEVK